MGTQEKHQIGKIEANQARRLQVIEDLGESCICCWRGGLESRCGL